MKSQHEVLMENPEYRRLFSVESLVAEAAEMIAELMSERKMTKADLARRLNKSRAWVTQLLSGNTNMTIRTLAEVVYALDAEVKLDAQLPEPVGAGCQPVFEAEPYTVVDPSFASERVFRVRSDQMNSAGEYLAPVGFRPPSQFEYAA